MKNHKTLRTVVNVILMLAFSVGVGYFFLYQHLDEVRTIIAQADYGWVAAALALTVGYYFFGGMVLTVLTRRIRPDYSWRQGYECMQISALFHNITPSSSGGQFAQFYIFKKQGVGYQDAGLILFIELLSYKTVMVAFCLVMMVFNINYLAANEPRYIWLAVAGFVCSGLVIGAMLVTLMVPAVYNWVFKTGVAIGYRFHMIKDPQAARDSLQQMLVRFKAALRQLKGEHALLGRLIMLNVTRDLCYFSGPLACMAALHVAVPYGDYVLVIAMTSMVVNIAMYFPAPGASGGMEGLFVIMFSTIMSSGEATSVMMFWRLTSFYFATLAGLMLFIYYRFFYKPIPVAKGGGISAKGEPDQDQ